MIFFKLDFVEETTVHGRRNKRRINRQKKNEMFPMTWITFGVMSIIVVVEKIDVEKKCYHR